MVMSTSEEINATELKEKGPREVLCNGVGLHPYVALSVTLHAFSNATS